MVVGNLLQSVRRILSVKTTNSMWDFLNCKNDAEFDKLCLRFTKWAQKDLEMLQKKRIKLDGKELSDFLQQKKQEALKMGGQIFVLHKDLLVKYKEKKKSPLTGKKYVNDLSKIIENYQMPIGEYLYKVEQICRKDKEPEVWKIDWQERWANFGKPGENPYNEYDFDYTRAFREKAIDQALYEINRPEFRGELTNYVVFPPHQETPPCQVGIMGRKIGVYFPDIKHDGGKINVDKMMAWAKENGYDTCQHFFMGNENIINSKEYYTNLPFMNLEFDTSREEYWMDEKGELRSGEPIPFRISDLYKDFEEGKCPPPHEWNYEDYIKYIKMFRDEHADKEENYRIRNTIGLSNRTIISEHTDIDPMYGNRIIYDQRKGCFTKSNPFVPQDVVGNVEFAVFWDNSVDWLEVRQEFARVGRKYVNPPGNYGWQSAPEEMTPKHIPYPITGSPAVDFLMDIANTYANFKEYLPNCTEEEITKRIEATFAKYPENRAFYDFFPDRREIPYRNMYSAPYAEGKALNGGFVGKSDYTSVSFDPYLDKMAKHWWVDDCPFDINKSKYLDMIQRSLVYNPELDIKYYRAFTEYPEYPEITMNFVEIVTHPNGFYDYDTVRAIKEERQTVVSSKLPKFYEFKPYELERQIAYNEMTKEGYAPPKHFKVVSAQEGFEELKENAYESLAR